MGSASSAVTTISKARILPAFDTLPLHRDGRHLKEFKAVSPVGKQLVARDCSRATAQNAKRFLADYQHFHSHVRPHQALDWKTPNEYLQSIKDRPTQSHM